MCMRGHVSLCAVAAGENCLRSSIRIVLAVPQVHLRCPYLLVGLPDRPGILSGRPMVGGQQRYLETLTCLLTGILRGFVMSSWCEDGLADGQHNGLYVLAVLVEKVNTQKVGSRDDKTTT